MRETWTYAARARASSAVARWLARPDVRCALLATALLRVGCSILAALAVLSGGAPFRGSNALDYLVRVWDERDTIIYVYIAQHGYTFYGTTFFPPLYPACIRVVAALTSGDAIAAALLISTVAAYFMFLALYQFADRFAPESGLAPWTVVVAATLPTAFIFMAGYTESVFLALAMWAVLAMLDRRWGRLALLGAAGALTRQQGFLIGLLAAPAAWQEAVWIAGWRSSGVKSAEMDKRVRHQFDWRPLFAGAVPVFAYGAWLLVIRFVLHAPLPQELATSTRIWNLHLTWPGLGIVDDLLALTHPDQSLGTAVLDATASLAALAALVIAARRIPVALTLYLAAMFCSAQIKVLPSGLTSSEGRYMLELLPLCVVPAGWLMRHPRVRLVWTAVGIMGMILYLWAFVLNLWTP